MILFNKPNILINRVGRPHIPVGSTAALKRRQDMHAGLCAVQIPGLSVSDISVEFQRLVLCRARRPTTLPELTQFESENQ